MAASILRVSLEMLAPKAVWLTLIATMLFSLLPTPLQPLLLPIFHRGKLLQPSSSPSRYTVPQRFFLHFYIVGTVFNGVLLLIIITYIHANRMSNFDISIKEAWRVVAILFLFELQVLRRLYESIYVSKFSRHAQMHILAYLLGLMYYILAPLSLFPRAVEVIVGGYSPYEQGHKKREMGIEGGNPLLLLGLPFWIGASICVWGWIHQYRCHSILASLRANNVKNNEDGQYRIPYGDWFEYVSCAHYLAEFVIYSGFIVATRGLNMDTWLLFFFVVLNLSIAASDSHKWYRRKFKNYPSFRKAVIPFIY